MKSFGCMPAVRTPEASRTLTVSCPGILPSPLRDKVGAFDHDRFRGYVSVHFRSGLRPPCLRFAVAVAGHHARLGTRLLVRLCRDRHHRRLNSMRLQGATLAGRVEDWRAGRPRYLDRSTSPAPSTSHATCGFPALRAPICFMPRLMGPILPGRLSARRGALDSRETASGCCTATAYSIAPSRSPVVSERAPNGA